MHAFYIGASKALYPQSADHGYIVCLYLQYRPVVTELQEQKKSMNYDSAHQHPHSSLGTRRQLLQ